MHISRYQGFGNDFLIIFSDEIPSDASDMAERLCNRKKSIGADGLIFGTPSNTADAFFTLYNSDGSQAEVSGNGLACFGYALYKNNRAKKSIKVETKTALHPILISEDSTNSLLVQVSLSPPDTGPDFQNLDINLGGPKPLRVASVDVGNPHLVIEVDEIESVELGTIGPKVESHFMPIGCNIHLVSIVSQNEIQLRTWERGAGLTEACGSGAIAAASAANAWQAVSDEVKVVMPGGVATVILGDYPTYVCQVVDEGEFEALDD